MLCTASDSQHLKGHKIIYALLIVLALINSFLNEIKDERIKTEIEDERIKTLFITKTFKQTNITLLSHT